MFTGSDQVASPDTSRRISHANAELLGTGSQTISRPEVLVHQRDRLHLNINCFLKLDVKHMFMERSPVAIKISLLR